MFWCSNFQPEGKVALIVGASQGIGVEIAYKLYERNCSVILVARRESKLKQQVARIEKEVGERNASVSFVTCDVADYERCVDLWNTVTERGQDPDFVFCCAGSSIPKLFQDLSSQDISNGINVNYSTAVNIVHSGFKHVLSANEPIEQVLFKQRHVILFSSVVSFFPFIGYAQYAPMKSAIQSLSTILRQELGPYNYRVSCIFPGNFMSEGFEEEEKTKPEITKEIEGPSNPILGAQCADIILKGLDRGYDTVTTDLIGWFLSCSSLGVLPRCWGLFQVIVSLVLLIFAPVAMWVIQGNIMSYFKKHRKSSSKKIEEQEGSE